MSEARPCDPCGKVAWPTRARARLAARTLVELGVPRRGFHAYRCPVTPAWWHVGHRMRPSTLPRSSGDRAGST